MRFWFVLIVLSFLFAFLFAFSEQSLPSPPSQFSNDLQSVLLNAKNSQKAMPLIIASDPQCVPDILHSASLQKVIADSFNQQPAAAVNQQIKKMLQTNEILVPVTNELENRVMTPFILHWNAPEIFREINVLGAKANQGLNPPGFNGRTLPFGTTQHQTATPAAQLPLVGLTAQVSWGGGQATFCQMNAGINVPLNNGKSQKIRALSCHVAIGNSNGHGPLQVTGASIGVQASLGQDGRFEGSLSLSNNPKTKNALSFDQFNLNYLYQGALLHSTQVQNAQITFKTNDKNQIYLANLKTILALKDQKQATIQYQQQKDKLRIQTLELAYADNAPIIPNGKNAGKQLSKIDATFNLENSKDADVLKNLDIFFNSANKQTTSQTILSPDFSATSVTSSNKAGQNQLSLHFGQYAPQQLNPAMDDRTAPKKLLVFEYGDNQQTGTVTTNSVTTFGADFMSQISKNQFVQTSKSIKQKFIVAVDPTNLEKTLFLTNFNIDTNRQDHASATLVFSPVGFQRLDMDFTPQGIARTIQTTQSVMDVYGFTRTSQNQQTRYVQNGLVNHYFFTLTGPSSDKRQYTANIGFYANVHSQKQTRPVQITLHFPRGRSVAKNDKPADSLAAQIITQAFALVQYKLQSHPDSLEKVNLDALEKVAQTVVVAALDPKTQLTAEQVAKISNDPLAQQAYLAYEKLNQQPPQMLTYSPDEVIQPRNYALLTNLCVTNGLQSDCILPANDYSTSDHAVLRNLAKAYLIRGVVSNSHSDIAVVGINSGKSGIIDSFIPAGSSVDEVTFQKSLCDRKYGQFIFTKQTPDKSNSDSRPLGAFSSPQYA